MEDPITVGGTQYPNRKAFVETGRRCGTPLPSLNDIRRTERVRSALRTNRIDFNTKTVVPVYVHIIQEGRLGNLSEQQIGMTAVHEVGHWAGLFNTFQGGCATPGDEVEDTAFEEFSATGCPLRQLSSCPGETRFNPVENYMDYSDDACMKEFTPIQIQRIKDMVGYYRYQRSRRR